MKKLLYLSAFLLMSQGSKAQQNYCDFEGTKAVTFGFYSGIIDTQHVNPSVTAMNPSAMCAKYIRDTALYDNIKLYPDAKLIDVTPYANNSISTPKIKLKVYTSAPVGSIVQIQLGTKNDNSYPSGTHSEYQAVTTIQNGWQQLTFNYFQSPVGSLVSPIDIDKIVILFRPNSSGRDTLYFDDITGPEIFVPSGIHSESIPTARLFQNVPNPAKEKTYIGFHLNFSGFVSLKIYDMVGNAVISLVEENMKAGSYSVPVETSAMPNGVYFYTLQTGSTKRSMKMIVSN